MSRLSKWWKANRPKWWRGAAPTPGAQAGPKGREPYHITEATFQQLLEEFGIRGSPELTPITIIPRAGNPFKSAPVPKWAEGGAPMAMDYSLESVAELGGETGWSEGITWLGFPFLAELTQRPEYRMIYETRAKEMTRKWIEFTYTGEGEDGDDKIKELSRAMDKHKIRDHFRLIAEHDGWAGGGHLFIDVGESFDRPDELKTVLLADPKKVTKGGKLAFRVIEPTWVYPLVYDSSNPLSPTYFKPQTWSVNGTTVHRSRLLTFVSREVPDILKPAYSFRGLSISQMAMPYVNNWLRTRQSVSDIIHSFTVFVLKTVMAQNLDLNAMRDLYGRIALFNLVRDNKGTFIVDKESEDFENVSAPLSGLEDLQAQSQEQLASVSQTPLVKLLGIQPAGLNASSEGEIRVYYDTTHANQEHLFSEHLTTVVGFIQLDLWGEIDPDISWAFVPLWELDEAARASVEKTKTDTDVENVNAGIVSAEEARKRLAADKKSQYQGLDLSGPAPEPEEDEDDTPIEADPARTAEPRKTERSGV